MKKTIEWYDQGIIALNKLVKQHEIELELTINQIEDHIKTQKKKLEIDQATGEAKKLSYEYERYDYDEDDFELSREGAYKLDAKFSDITSAIDLLKKLNIYIQSYCWSTKLWRVRKSLVSDLEKCRKDIARNKGREIKEEKKRLTTLLTLRQKLKRKLESQGTEVPVLNLEQDEQEIKAGVQEYKPLIQFTKNVLTRFLKVITEPDSIIKLIETAGLRNVKEVIDIFYAIHWKLGESGMVCPSCQKIYMKKKINICEVCGHDFMKT